MAKRSWDVIVRITTDPPVSKPAIAEFAEAVFGAGLEVEDLGEAEAILFDTLTFKVKRVDRV